MKQSKQMKSNKTKLEIYQDVFRLFLKFEVPSDMLLSYIHDKDGEAASVIQEFIVNNLEDEITDWCTGIGVMETADLLYKEALANGNVNVESTFKPNIKRYVAVIHAPITERYWTYLDIANIYNGHIQLGGAWFKFDDRFIVNELDDNKLKLIEHLKNQVNILSLKENEKIDYHITIDYLLRGKTDTDYTRHNLPLLKRAILDYNSLLAEYIKR